MCQSLWDGPQEDSDPRFKVPHGLWHAWSLPQKGTLLDHTLPTTKKEIHGGPIWILKVAYAAVGNHTLTFLLSNAESHWFWAWLRARDGSVESPDWGESCPSIKALTPQNWRHWSSCHRWVDCFLFSCSPCSLLGLWSDAMSSAVQNYSLMFAKRPLTSCWAPGDWSPDTGHHTSMKAEWSIPVQVTSKHCNILLGNVMVAHVRCKWCIWGQMQAGSQGTGSCVTGGPDSLSLLSVALLPLL